MLGKSDRKKQKVYQISFISSKNDYLCELNELKGTTGCGKYTVYLCGYYPPSGVHINIIIENKRNNID